MTPALHTAEEDEHPMGRVGAPEDDLVPLCESSALEEGCNLAGLVPQPGIGPAQVPERRLEEECIARCVLRDRSPEKVDNGLAVRCVGLTSIIHDYVLLAAGVVQRR